MTVKEIFDKMIEKEASDVFIRVGSRLHGRIFTEVKEMDGNEFTSADVERIVSEMLKPEEIDILQRNRSYEFACWYSKEWRFRVGVFYQRNTLSLVIRKVNLRIPTFKELNLPDKVLENFCGQRRGLILLTGTTGSGKSTTIASMIEFINQNFYRHILTIEEPIEFTFEDKKSIINQREIGKDVSNYEDALRQFTVHSPDVIYIGNIRDYETCKAALTAAETGVLVISSLHTVNASSTVERIVNFFPPHQHASVMSQLSSLLKGVISLRLIPRVDKEGLIPAYEIIALSPTIARLLRENKLWEMPKYIVSGDIYGMKSFNQCLFELVKEKKISPMLALDNSDKKEELELNLRNNGLL
ncbi:MAG: PilT/PilU family type 4a pilus ATPase [Candidatus Omnitrophica bacterium]|nr:PilT/PilU family type 4a pilus ATPase [Candidatus Omnitrophota bacterium]MCM8827134.1 PilT/PilU family type 4a pilus ATPase [Candidatus Omnitrophota bacterium]